MKPASAAILLYCARLAQHLDGRDCAVHVHRSGVWGNRYWCDLVTGVRRVAVMRGGLWVPITGTHKVGGYSILQGESLEEISKLLDGHPHFHSPDASVEVREFLSMPGMS